MFLLPRLDQSSVRRGAAAALPMLADASVSAGRLTGGFRGRSGQWPAPSGLSVGFVPLGWYLLGGVGGHVLITEFHDMALNGIFCAGVLRPLDLVPLTDFTNKYHPGALPSWQSISCKEELNLLSPDMFHQ